MSTSERLIDGPFAKRLVIVSATVPGLLLVWDAFRGQLGVNDVNFAIRTTGMVGLVLLVLSFAVTPIRAITGWQTAIATRRNFGVIGFFYLSAHFLIFFWLDRQASVASTFDEIVKRRYLWFGTGALTLMVPLAITSTDQMVARLGTSWKTLQRLTYLVVIGAVIHYYMLVKSDIRLPLAFAGIVAALFVFRGVHHYVGLRAAVRKARAAGATKAASHGRALQTGKPAFWSGELVIARIFDETHDVKTFRFVSPDGRPLPFTHTAGQYLNLMLTISGTRVNRSYTIASSPTRNAYCEISVKLVPNGFVSHHLHETWREGDRVKVSAPAGKFVFSGHEAKRVVLIAGGIGVTPMMSVVRSLTDRAWAGDIYFILSIKTVRDFTFRDELAYLAARHPQLHVLVMVSNDPDTTWDGQRGHITRDALETFTGPLTRGPVLLCGPGPMMDAMRAILVSMGVPDAEIHQEAFISPPATAERAVTFATSSDAGATKPPVALADAETATITFARSGQSASITGAQTVLEAAEDAGIDVPFECRSGICGQCRAKLISGQVVMDVDDALTAADRSNGVILACQAHATGDLEIDA